MVGSIPSGSGDLLHPQLPPISPNLEKSSIYIHPQIQDVSYEAQLKDISDSNLTSAEKDGEIAALAQRQFDAILQNPNLSQEQKLDQIQKAFDEAGQAAGGGSAGIEALEERTNILDSYEQAKAQANSG